MGKIIVVSWLVMANVSLLVLVKFAGFTIQTWQFWLLYVPANVLIGFMVGWLFGETSDIESDK